jgi:hypothetical protein
MEYHTAQERVSNRDVSPALMEGDKKLTECMQYNPVLIKFKPNHVV